MATGESLVRIHHVSDGPVWFGPAGPDPRYRFDAPAGEYKTMYTARTVRGAFVETVLRSTGRIIQRAYVEERCWTQLVPTRPLTVAKIYDEGLLFHGVNAAISSGDSYVASRQLALALHQLDDQLDGIAYRAKHNNGEVCFAFFDRADPSTFHKIGTSRFDAHPILADALAAQHGAEYDLSPPLAKA